MSYRQLRTLVFILAIIITVVAHYALQGPGAQVATPKLRPIGDLGLITEPAAGIAPVIEHINDAKTSIDLVMYQFTDVDVAQALISAEKRGVQVRVLLNHGYRGQATPGNEPMYALLKAGGVAVKWTPGYFDLTHEKSLVIDGTTTIVMTLNLTPQYYLSGREFALVDKDVNDATAAEATFAADWSGQKTTARAGDGLIWSPGALHATVALIASAHKSLEIYNEEMADTQVTQALEAAAKRGVDVRVCMTYSSSWKSAFNELVAAGVHVETYAATAPRYIHAKMVVADESEAFVGSQNFSGPSLSNNRELGLETSDTDIISGLEAAFGEDWAQARPYN